SHLIESRQEAVRERHVALMVIHDIEGYCNLVENTMEEWEYLDSINNFILDYVSEDSVQIADSTLNFFLENLGHRNDWAYNITTQNIFNSNIEIWQDISDKNFIENTGKCFSLMSVIDETHKEYNSYVRQAYDSYLINVESVLTDDISLRQEVQRAIQEADVKLAIDHLSGSLPVFKDVLHVIRALNEQNKKIMNISDEELNAIFNSSSIKSI
ncbi:MAG: hypothetical protein IIV13_05190, partial [Bacteroidaceae bacterium]|nr:hypothetical protein [Bacteroidaceae bacterium]